MESFEQLLLDVWREACRHVEIGDAVAECAPTLFNRLPVDLLMVRRIDVQRQSLETVAIGLCQPGPSPGHTRTDLKPGQFEQLKKWCLTGEIEHGNSDSLELLPGLLPSEVEGEVLVGPLNATEGPVGVVILVARPPHRFDAEHEQMVRLLLEPFTFWLANDRRLRELSALREAAEADKLSLLSRLGRHDLSDSIVGEHGGLKGVMERVELVARADVPVLILGETGSGKEVVSRAIHQRSSRASGPFLRVNCGAIPAELVDSELFGHERGSFTGAVGERKGWFERADGGTLFLDECGELPPAAQVRLLRILQDGTFERVGGERQLSVDVRVIAATHRDLPAMVSEGRFREDLWYRLAVFPLRLPPLRERKEDIPTMAAHFAARAAQRLGMPNLLPTPEDLQLLTAYPWPGNVRELAAVIERAVILGDGTHLEIAKSLGLAPTQSLLAITSIRAEADEPEGEFLTLEGAMRRHIAQALRKTRGQVEGVNGAAKLLDINPHTLRARMRKLNLDWATFRE